MPARRVALYHAAEEQFQTGPAADALPQFQPYVPENLFKYAMLAVLVGNLVLRFRTSTALQDK